VGTRAPDPEPALAKDLAELVEVDQAELV